MNLSWLALCLFVVVNACYGVLKVKSLKVKSCYHLTAVSPGVLVFAFVFPVNLTCINTAAG